MRRREFIQNKSEDQPVELIEATGGDPSNNSSKIAFLPDNAERVLASTSSTCQTMRKGC